MNRRDALRTLGAVPAVGALMSCAGGVLNTGQRSATAPHQDRGPHDRTIRINGADLTYSIAGEQNDHPMILLHGGRGFGTHDSLFASHEVLSDRYKVIGFDMRGHGRSSVTPPFTFDQIVEDVERLRQTLGGGRKMILSGGSFGGFIALSYAVKYPQHLTHLVLRGTAPSYRHEEVAIASFEARAAARAPAATRAMLHKLMTPGITDDEEFRLIMFALQPMYLPEGQQPDYDQILETCRKTTYRARVHNDLFMPEVWRAYDVESQLNLITVPTLVICGETDWIVGPGQSRIIAAGIRDSTLVIVPGVDHSVPGDILVAETRRLLGAS